MKFWGIFRFEVAYQARRPWTWITVAALLVFAFLGTGANFAADATRDDFYLNSPFVVAVITVIGGMIWLLLGALTAGDAAARDVDAGMHPLIYTAPLGKTEYLGARFLAALLLNALILLTVPAGILLAVYEPGVEPGLVGPFRSLAFINAYALIALPNAFIATAIQFAFAAASGRPRAAYLGSVMLFFTVYVVGVLLGLMGKLELAKFVDAIGLINIVAENLVEWTPAEKRTRLFTLDGTLLANRLLWLGIATAALAVTWQRFRFTHRIATTWWSRMTRRRNAASPTLADPPFHIPHFALRISEVRQAFGFATHVRQMRAITWASFRTIATSKAGLFLLVAVPLLLVVVVPEESAFSEVPLVPTTAAVVRFLTGPLIGPGTPLVIVPLLLVFYAGELVWREREAGLGEIVGAAPLPDWVPFLGKFLGLMLVLVLFQALLMAAGIVGQSSVGYRDIEIGLYLLAMFGLQIPEYLLVAVLVLVVHTVINQKHLGHVAAILALVLIPLLPAFGIEHNLLVYGSTSITTMWPGPRWSYTEMRGFGPSLGPWAWFKLYWAAWALLLAVTAMALWVRGTEARLAARLTLARRRLTGGMAWAAGTAVVLIVTLGGFIFYNTNVLNEYVSTNEVTERRVEYERRFRRYESVPQPGLAGVSLRVEIYPERRQVEIHGTYTLVNRGEAAIDSLHLATGPGRRTATITLDRPWVAVLADDKLRHHIYALERPLLPGDSLRLGFEVRYAPRGFRNDGADLSVVANGTFFTDAWLPAIGYQQRREITSASDRRQYGLAPRPLIIPSLYDQEARHDRTWSETSAFEAIVGTAEGQTAVAPGDLRRTWREHPSLRSGQAPRRYFHYVSDKPIGREWYFFSAAYAVHEARWKEVPITVFYHPAHARNVERMVSAAQATLDYHARHYSPYANREVRMVEHAGTGVGAHAGPLGINFSERYAALAPRPRDVDLPFAVMAHELAHHWWGGQLDYAVVEGAPLLAEGLAWYGAMRTVEAALGREQLERLRAFMRMPYPIPPIRRGKPLLQADDPYAAYRKGPYAMYALAEYVGVERVNTALRRLVARHTAPGAPLATSLDLYRELLGVTPDSLRYLARDLFERNTYWDLRTDRVTAEQNADSTWRVTLDVYARQLVADSAGVETEVPLDQWIDIGVFAEGEPGQDELNAPLYLERHRIRSGRQTITVTVPRRPALAGIDPRHVLDWEEKEDDDNIERVEILTPEVGPEKRTLRGRVGTSGSFAGA